MESSAQFQPLIDEAKKIKAERAVAEQFVRECDTRLKTICEELLPALMDELGVEKATLSDGSELRLTNNVYAHIAAVHQEAAFAWLRSRGLGDIIKEVTKVSVHPSTLKAQLRELLEAGVDVPQTLFGVYQQRAAIISE